MSPGRIMQWEGRILKRQGRIAYHSDCCCESESSASSASSESGSESVPAACPGHPPMLDAYAVTWVGQCTPANCPGLFGAFPDPPATVSKVGDCRWGGTFQNYPESSVDLWLDTVNGRWEISLLGFGAEAFRGIKTMGADPTGTYAPLAGHPGNDCGCITSATVS